jgi:hypothetical protein
LTGKNIDEHEPLLNNKKYHRCNFTIFPDVRVHLNLSSVRASGHKQTGFYVTELIVLMGPTFESLTAEREQVRKIHNMSFRHLGILLLQKNTYESLTAEREQVRKIHNMSFRHLGILPLQKNTYESLMAERKQVRKIHNMSFRHLSIFL